MARKKFIWTETTETILKEKYPDVLSLHDLAEEIGCTVGTIYSKAYKLRLKRGDKRNGPTGPRPIYSPEQLEFVRKNYPQYSNLTLSALSGVPISRIKAWAIRNGWHKSETYLSECRAFADMKRRESAKRWRKKNPDKLRLYQKRYWDKKKAMARMRDNYVTDTFPS